MSHIFISYSHHDSAYAQKLAAKLGQNGFSCWIDDRIAYGSQWPNVIQEKLDGCVALIVIMTSHAFRSQWVQNELNRAQRKNKPVFPLLLEGDEPWLSVETVQYTDVRGGSLPPQQFYETLARALRPMQQGAPAIDPPQGKTTFAVLLKGIDPMRKIAVVKTVRELTHLDLKAAKNLVENPPQFLLKGATKEAAETVKRKLEESGAVVEIK